jgi:alkylation response protein AidB-like acyl-CoA dehydrogenase
MDIRLNQDQVEIGRQARRFLENECPAEFVRTMFTDDRGFTDEIWNKMAEMGWTALRIPEEYGGLGMDLLDLAVVLEEMGRAVVPGPFFSTVLLAGEIIMESGNDLQKERYLPGIAAGKMKGTLALHEPDGGADPGHIQMAAQSDGDDFVLNGTKLFVPDAHVADFLVCVARTKAGTDPNAGMTLFLVDPEADGVCVTLLPTMDGTRKLCAVDFDGMRVDSEAILGDLHGGWKALSRVLQRAQVGLCAECVGGAYRAMELATEYARSASNSTNPSGPTSPLSTAAPRCTWRPRVRGPSYTGPPGPRATRNPERLPSQHRWPRHTVHRFTPTPQQALYRYWEERVSPGNTTSTSISNGQRPTRWPWETPYTTASGWPN